MKNSEKLSQSIISFNTINDNIDSVNLNYNSLSKINKFLNEHFFYKIFLIIIFILSYTFSAIYIRINYLECTPLQAAYIQCSVFIIFIPFSFIINLYNDNKQNLNDDEFIFENELDIERKMESNFSELIEKKYYETYYSYYNNFIKNAFILFILFVCYLIFFYFASCYVTPLLNQIIFLSLTSFIMMINKFLGRKKIKNLNLKILFIIINILLCTFFILMYKNYLSNFKMDKIKIGILLIIVSSLFFSMFLIYFNLLIKKYHYYFELVEMLGYMGLYCFIFLFIIIFILHILIKNEKFNYPTGHGFLILIFKCIISSLFCDFSLLLLFRYFNTMIISQIFLILIGILSGIYCFYKKYINNIFLYIAEGLELINIIILIYKLKKKFNKIQINKFTYSKVIDKNNIK